MGRFGPLRQCVRFGLGWAREDIGMKTTATGFAAALLLAAPACAQDAGGDAVAVLQAEVHALRAREDIRELLHAYGRTIDARDFAAFGALWARDAEYAGGGPGGPAVGPEAIAAYMSGIIGENPLGFAEPNAHIFFNEQIAVDGGRATGTSMSAFVTPDADGVQQLSIVTRYEDEYVLEDGAWKFARRAVAGLRN